jgi:hypothetical protein
MSAVVVVGRKGLAARTEVGVITDSALVANSVDVTLGRLVLAQWTIAEDAIMDLMLTSRFTDGIVNLHESMTRVALGSSQDALRAEVPIGAGQALVTNTNDALVTAVTDSSVSELPTWKATRGDQILQAEVPVRSKVECVARVVSMLISEETAKAKIIVLAVIAADEIAFVGFTTAPIAHWLVIALNGCIQTSRFGHWLRSRLLDRIGCRFLNRLRN